MAQDDRRLRENRRRIQGAYDQADRVGRRQKNTARPGTITGTASAVMDSRINNARPSPTRQVTEPTGPPGALREGFRGTGEGSGFTATQLASGSAIPPRGPGQDTTGRVMSAMSGRDNVGLQQYYGPGGDTGPAPLMPTLRNIGGSLAETGRNVGGYLAEEIDNAGGGLRGAMKLAMTRPEQLADASRWLGTQMASAADVLGQTPGGGQRAGNPGGNSGVATGPQGNTPGADPRAGQTAMGYWSGPDGRKNFIPGTQPNSGPGSNLTVMNFDKYIDGMQKANAIRQEMIDSQRPQNQVTMIPNTGIGGGGQGGDINGQIQRLAERAGRTSNLTDRAAINRQISQLQQVADRGATQQSGMADRENNLAVQQLRNQGALQTASLGGSVNPYDFARAQQVTQEMQDSRNPLPSSPPLPSEDALLAIQSAPEAVQGQLMTNYMQQLDKANTGYQINQQLDMLGASFDEALAAYQQGELEGDPLGDLMNSYFGSGVLPTNEQTEDFSMGGLVPEMSALGFAQGGMVPDQYGAQMGPGMDTGTALGMAAPGTGGIDMMQIEYDQYAQGAQQLGVPAIPFEEFVGLKQQAIPQAQGAPGPQQPMTGAMQSAVGMAGGGMVPGMDQSDASGKMIVDPNPDAPQDSIPATIDGQRPAKLDSGEFVIPKHVVMWHGIDKLNKLIAQAEEKGQGNGTESGAAGANQTATGGARA